MQKDVEHFVTRICECVKRKAPNKITRAPLTTIKTTYPFELVSIDFLHLERCRGVHEYILAVMDHFTRFAQAYAMKNKSAKTVVEKIFNDYALKFSFPARIHHDMDREFEPDVFSVGVALWCPWMPHYTVPPPGKRASRKIQQNPSVHASDIDRLRERRLEELPGKGSARL